MIYVQMGGRIGNQLFRYAAARAIQIQYYPNDDLCLNFKYLKKEGKESDGWVNGLNDYNVAPYTLHNKKKVMGYEGTMRQKLLCLQYYSGLRHYSRQDMKQEYEYEIAWSEKLNRAGVYWYRTGYIPLTKSEEPIKLMSGCFESSEYFDGIRDTLLKEFTPKYPKAEHNYNLYQIAEQSNSVCISIRRGDYESNPAVKQLHGVCTKEYYQSAINYIQEIVSNPVFILFSDDIEWVKNNIQIDGYRTYYEDGNDPVWEKLRLMSTCKHFIISNSTFSWWAQWLAVHQDKIVICPQYWFNNNFNWPLIEKSMIKMGEQN